MITYSLHDIGCDELAQQQEDSLEVLLEKFIKYQEEITISTLKC